jgi:hypothetical protein
MLCKKGIVLLFATVVGTAALAPSGLAQELQSCQGTPSVFAQAWDSFSKHLVLSHPTEVQNLVDLRLRINSLRSKKQELVVRIKTIADFNDAPGWLEARLNLKALNEDIDSTLRLIDDTARQAGWLAGSNTLGDLLLSLRSRKAQTICELARIPFPLSASDKQRLTNLLQALEQENIALGEFDKQIGELIKKATNR